MSTPDVLTLFHWQTFQCHICLTERLLIVMNRLCGHKEINTKLDGKTFGFPFDRKFGFKISDTHK